MKNTIRVAGVVKKHLGRGKTLGFPTANIEIENDIEDGIYVGLTRIHNSPLSPLTLRGERGELPSLIFIGAAQTFGESQRRAEVYILDFAGELYGQEIEVELIRKIRDNIKFDAQDDLVEQMKQDEAVAREYFGL